MNNIIQENPAFIYAPEINQICKGIFHRLKLNAFSYSKLFKDGSRAELWSDPAALEHSFFVKQYIYRIYTPNLLRGQKFALYDHTVEKFPTELRNRLTAQLVDQREIFNHDNCFFIIEYKEEYTEYFAFYSAKNDTSVVDTYLNHLDVLNRFCHYFRQRAKPIIQKAEKNRLIKPWLGENIKPIVEVVHSDLDIRNRHKPLIELTDREKEVGDLLCEGMTAREAAEILCITPKSVEKHIENIKRKVGCSRKIQLVSILSSYEQ